MAIWDFLFRTLWKCKITKAQKAEVILLMEEAVKPFLEKYVIGINVIIWNIQLFTSVLTISICMLLYYLPRINTKIYPLFLLNMQPFPFWWKKGSQLYLRIPFPSPVYTVLLDQMWTLPSKLDIKSRLC